MYTLSVLAVRSKKLNLENEKKVSHIFALESKQNLSMLTDNDNGFTSYAFNNPTVANSRCQASLKLLSNLALMANSRSHVQHGPST